MVLLTAVIKKLLSQTAAAGRRLLFLLNLHRSRAFILLEVILLLFLLLSPERNRDSLTYKETPFSSAFSKEKEIGALTGIEFAVPAETLSQAFHLDVSTCQKEPHLNWIELLALLASRYNGDFSLYQPSHMEQLALQLQNGTAAEALARDKASFSRYRNAYEAVLGEMVGLYEIQIPESEAPDFALADAQINEAEPKELTLADGERKVWVTKYGLKVFHPLARNFPCSHSDGFTASLSRESSHRNPGHRLSGQAGTPVIAVESGYVESAEQTSSDDLHLTIRSFDRKRCYHYARLCGNPPGQAVPGTGSIVTAGDVIGCLKDSRSTDKTAGAEKDPQLSFGLQLLVEDASKEGPGELWIDCSELLPFLSIHRSDTVKKDGTGEWIRLFQMKDPAVIERIPH